MTKTREELEVEISDLWLGLLRVKEMIRHSDDCRSIVDDFCDLRCDCGALRALAEADELLSEIMAERPRRRDASPVVVFDFGPPELVFHRFEEWDARPHPEKLEDGWIRNEHRTRCGMATWAIERRDVPGRTSSEVRNELNRGTVLRRDHAERIGRPCARCAR